MPISIKAGYGVASAGVWVRPRSSPGDLLLPTVAHILFGRDQRPRAPVRANGVEAIVVGAVPLVERRSFPADAAVLALPPEQARAHFFPAGGHLNRFCPGLSVQCNGCSGRPIYGRLVGEGWSGLITYPFGSRRLTQQWVVAIDAAHSDGGRIRRGDSGAVWMSQDGVAVGLQVAVLRSRPEYVLLTPFETICNLFNVAVAG